MSKKKRSGWLEAGSLGAVWLGAGSIEPAPVQVQDNRCDACGGTGKDYRNCWDIGDAMFPDDCPECAGTGEQTNE